MIEVSENEFEKYILDLINKRITRVELAKKLQTDTRTLSNRIYGITNEKLLKEYLEQYPYKPRQNKNVNYEALIVQLIQSNITAKEMQERYEIAERTYRRNIKKVKESNERLYMIYENYIKGKITDEDYSYINSLDKGVVVLCDNVEDRKAELMCFFMEYKQLLNSGLTEKQALEQLGETTKSIKRKSDELDRIIKGEKIKKGNKYKESLKFNVSMHVNTGNDFKEEHKIVDEQIEGEVK